MKLNSNKTIGSWILSSVLAIAINTIPNSSFGQKKKDNKSDNNSEQDESNFVRNGSFENLKSASKKPKKGGGIDFIEGWSSPTDVKADTYRGDTQDPKDSKKRPIIGMPENQFGQEEAYEGKSYVGFHAFITGKKPLERSYITGELTTKLVKNKTYCVEYWVSLAEGSKYACNNLGAQFKTKDPSVGGKGLMKPPADILHPDNKVFNSANGWFKVCGTYQAKGGEQYVVIGNFEDNKKTTSETFKKPKNAPKVIALQSAYYYIDNVVVREYFPTLEAYLISNNLQNLAKSDDDLSEDEIAEKEEYRKKFEKIPACTCGSSKDDEKTYSELTFQKDFIIDEKMSPKQKIETYSVYFSAGKAELTTEAVNTIDEISRILKANPSLTMTIVGHADTVETNLSDITPEYREIDKKRAEAVSVQLKKNGVTNSLLIDLKGVKEESDLVSGDEEEKELDWAKNRRVQFVIK